MLAPRRPSHRLLSHDPVGQGERSQFCDPAKGTSRFNLVCGEHAVLGNPMYLGVNLARYRIWDGIRALDYLASRPEVNVGRIGCVGNSGGGTLTAYISALDARVQAAAIGCYITTLPQRMATRIQTDPDADPEQDLFGFVAEGIDHAGLFALRAPRPTLLASARFDFFPIEGARETFTEASRLYGAAGATESLAMVEAAEKHGLSRPLRQAIYGFFARWLAGQKTDGEEKEIAVRLRSAKELRVCPDGQVNQSLQSRPLLTLALEEFDRRTPARKMPMVELLQLDPQEADYRIREIARGKAAGPTLVVCVSGNESRPWLEEKTLLRALENQGVAIVTVDPRGVGALRPQLQVRGHAYADPLGGVEADLAANAFLVGKSLLGMRVTDVQAAVGKLVAERNPARLVLCGRRDAALVAALAAAVEPRVTHLAVEHMLLTYRWYFDPSGRPINAASILPALLRDHGDLDQVLAALAPRRALSAAGLGQPARIRFQPCGKWSNASPSTRPC
jgi:dienelactone hydrolase